MNHCGFWRLNTSVICLVQANSRSSKWNCTWGIICFSDNAPPWLPWQQHKRLILAWYCLISSVIYQDFICRKKHISQFELCYFISFHIQPCLDLRSHHLSVMLLLHRCLWITQEAIIQHWRRCLWSHATLPTISLWDPHSFLIRTLV